jgi:hypothetical protein
MKEELRLRGIGQEIPVASTGFKPSVWKAPSALALWSPALKDGARRAFRSLTLRPLDELYTDHGPAINVSMKLLASGEAHDQVRSRLKHHAGVRSGIPPVLQRPRGAIGHPTSYATVSSFWLGMVGG